MNIGIIGGMGPEATAILFNHIVRYTYAEKDQDHIRVLIDNNTSIPDRTAYILGGSVDPLPFLIDTASNLEKMGANLLIMPCNTAHYFFDDIKKNTGVAMMNMIEETVKYIKENYNHEKIGLLATLGTYKIEIYKNILKNYGMTLIEPVEDDKNKIMDYIYQVKAGKDKDGLILEKVSENLINEGAGLVIMGCTELSVSLDKYNMIGSYIDPLKILAQSAIKFVGKRVRK